MTKNYVKPEMEIVTLVSETVASDVIDPSLGVDNMEGLE